MFIRTRLLVALALVLGIVVGTPAVSDAAVVPGMVPAAAGDTAGPAAGWELNMSVIHAGGPKCSASARWVTPETGPPSVFYTGSCIMTGVDRILGGFDPGSYATNTFYGQLDSGQACTMHDTAGVADGDLLRFEGSETAGFVWGVGGGSCSISRVCTFIKQVRNNWQDSDWGTRTSSLIDAELGAEGCVALELGSPPDSELGPVDAPTGCTSDAPMQPRVDPAEVFFSPNGYQYYVQNYAFRWPEGATGVNPPTGWAGYFVIRKAAGGMTVIPTTAIAKAGDTLAAEGFHDLAPSPSQTEGSLQMGDYNEAGIGLNVPPVQGVIVGAGVVKKDSVSGMGANALKVPQTHASGRVGITSGPGCSFYWGPKVASIVANETDEPVGPFLTGAGGSAPAPLVPPVDPEDVTEDPAGSCNFSMTDPSSWASGGICKLVSMIGAVLGLLGDIAGAIKGLVGALLEGLVGLFVPDSADLNDSVQGLQDKWDGTVIGHWKDAVTGQSYGMPSAGCNGVPVDFDLPGGVAVDLQLGSACSGTMANAAGIVKTVLSAGLIIYGGIACVRAIGSGFGWSPTIGKGGDPT